MHVVGLPRGKVSRLGHYVNSGQTSADFLRSGEILRGQPVGYHLPVFIVKLCGVNNANALAIIVQPDRQEKLTHCLLTWRHQTYGSGQS